MSIQALAQSLQRKIRSDFPLSSLSDPGFNVDGFLASCYSNKSRDVLELSKSLKRDLESFLESTEKTLSQSISQDFEKLLSVPNMMVGLDSEIEKLFKDSLILKNNLQKISEDSQQTLEKIDKSLIKLKENQENSEKLEETNQFSKIFQEIQEKSKLFYKFLSLPLHSKSKIPYGPLGERISTLLKKLSSFKHLKSSEFLKKKSEFLSNLQKELIELSTNPDHSENVESLLNCYSTLGLEGEVQLFLRDSVIFPKLKSFMPDQSVLLDDTFSIEDFYQNCHNELTHGQLQLFLLHKDSCDILLKSFWKGLFKVLMTKPKLFSPIFSHDYIKCLSQSFLTLNRLSQSALSGKVFISGEDYSEFIEKWNLPTFFELKKTEIVKPLLPLLKSEDLSSFCSQGAGKVYSEALKACLASMIVPELQSRFLRLYFQISSTYCNFIARRFNHQSKTRGSTKEDFLVALNDISFVKQEVLNSPVENEVKEEIQANLQQIIDPCARALTEIITKQCLTTLEGLKNIPSLYRMTGRAMPKNASSFMFEVFTPLKSLDLEVIPKEKIVTKVVLSFIDLHSEVKKEILKVGELINKYNPESQDSEKMTQQLLLDSQEFKNQLSILGFTDENNEAVKHLP
jgi:hypothetical protein